MAKAKLVESGFFVHEKGMCESTHVGQGTRIWAFAHVMAGAVIGQGCNLGEGVFVENNVKIGDNCTIKNGVCLWELVTLEADVFVGPHAVFTNDFTPRSFLKKHDPKYFLPTTVKRGATIGANATIVCGITIGEYALIGAGAVVTHDVPAHGLVVGNPGSLVGKVCFCGVTLKTHEYCPACEVSLNKNSPGHAARALMES
jgi:UDP-2-acetamido-3-amino-2,3-dideoxy-glucuronate N-acetyltransferase